MYYFYSQEEGWQDNLIKKKYDIVTVRKNKKRVNFLS